MRRAHLLFLILPVYWMISACSPLETLTPPPSPQPVRVAFTPTLRPFVERLHRCALAHPDISLITQETSVLSLVSGEADITLWFGEPQEGFSGHVFLLNTDEIVIVAGENVPIQNVDKDQLKDLFMSVNSAYQIWTYGPENELRMIFDQAVLGEAATSPEALLAPHPAAMIEAIAADPMAIGYLPNSWRPENIQSISITWDLRTALSHPLLAITSTQPTGHLRAYLACLQDPTS